MTISPRLVDISSLDASDPIVQCFTVLLWISDAMDCLCIVTVNLNSMYT